MIEDAIKLLEGVTPIIERALSGERVDAFRVLVAELGELLGDELNARKFPAPASLPKD